mmetsp:Transcript_58586/g.117682  ORF Transcript_58586/g.117682 Transcript_58586/m.117682 type:complete len:93 (-) Transcript_58586:365-643(-)
MMNEGAATIRLFSLPFDAGGRGGDKGATLFKVALDAEAAASLSGDGGGCAPAFVVEEKAARDLAAVAPFVRLAMVAAQTWSSPSGQRHQTEA